MIRKLIVAALVALVAAPAVSLYQLSLPELQSSAFMPDGGAKLVSVGSLLSTGLI